MFSLSSTLSGPIIISQVRRKFSVEEFVFSPDNSHFGLIANRRKKVLVYVFVFHICMCVCERERENFPLKSLWLLGSSRVVNTLLLCLFFVPLAGGVEESL